MGRGQGQQSTRRANHSFGPRCCAVLFPYPRPSWHPCGRLLNRRLHVPVHVATCVGLAVLEIPMSAPQTPLHVRHDGAQAPPVQPRGLRPQPVFPLPKALLARPSQTPLAVIPQEVKPSGRARVHHARLVGCRASPGSFTQVCTSSRACCASAALRHRITKSSAWRTIARPARAIWWSSGLRSRLASSGLMTPP